MLAQFGQEAEGISSRIPGIEKPPSKVATAAPPTKKDWYGSNASRSRDATPEGNPTESTGTPGAALERVRQSPSKEGTPGTTPGTSPGTTPSSTPLTTPLSTPLSTPGGTLERHWPTKDGTTEDPSPARKSDEARRAAAVRRASRTRSFKLEIAATMAKTEEEITRAERRASESAVVGRRDAASATGLTEKDSPTPSVAAESPRTTSPAPSDSSPPARERSQMSFSPIGARLRSQRTSQSLESPEDFPAREQAWQELQETRADPTKPGLPSLGTPHSRRLEARPDGNPFDILKLLSGKGFEDLLCFKDRRKAMPKSPLQRV